MTRVKICGIRNEDELRAAVTGGADAVGFLVGQKHTSPHFILPTTAARLTKLTPPFVQPVLVTHITDPEEIVRLMRETGIHTVQLHSDSINLNVIDFIRRKTDAKIVVATCLTAERQILDLMEIYTAVNGITLDHFSPEENKVGGTGKNCDWLLAAELVRRAPVPITLAGGLNLENVAEAIRTVHPYAVDVNTGMRDSNGNIDMQKCKLFCRTAAGC